MDAERCREEEDDCEHDHTTDESLGESLKFWEDQHPIQHFSCYVKYFFGKLWYHIYFGMLALHLFSFQALGFFHALNPWRARGENVGGTKGQYTLPSTSWGRRHITLMVSVNISLTPIPLACRTPPIPFFSPCSQPQPTHNPTTVPSTSTPLRLCSLGACLFPCQGHRRRNTDEVLRPP